MTSARSATVASIKPAQTTAVDDGVREVHGIAHDGDSTVHLCEQGNVVVLRRSAYDRRLTVRQARYIARKLHRLARRVEQRELAR